MATNNFQVTQEVADTITDALGTNFTENLVFGSYANHYFEDRFGVRANQIGRQIEMRLPTRVTTSLGQVATAQNLEQIKQTFAITKQRHARFDLSSLEYDYDLGNIQKQLAGPTGMQMAIDTDYDFFSDALSYVGQTIVASSLTQTELLKARALQSQQSAPVSRMLCGDPTDMSNLMDTLKSTFNPQDVISRINVDAKLGRWSGYDFAQTNSLPTILVGSDVVGAVAATISTQGADSISVSGLGANQVIANGQTLTIDGCGAITRAQRKATGKPYQFVVTEEVTLSGTGTGTIKVRPMYTAPSAYANMTAFPQSGAALTLSGAPGTEYRQVLAMTEQSFTIATLDLMDMTGRGVMSSFTTIDGYRLRMNLGSNIGSDEAIDRFDIVYGLAPMYEYQACKIWIPNT